MVGLILVRHDAIGVGGNTSNCLEESYIRSTSDCRETAVRRRTVKTTERVPTSMMCEVLNLRAGAQKDCVEGTSRLAQGWQENVTLGKLAVSG